MTKYPHFNQALESLGRNDRERAQALGIPQRTLTRYKTGRVPDFVLRLARYPALLAALVADIQATTPEAADVAHQPASTRDL